MRSIRPSNTQVYSPLGSYVVEQHGRAGREETLKQRYDRNTYGREKGIALAWLLLFLVLIGSSIHTQLGRPEISAMSQADAAVVTGTVGKDSNPSSD